MVLDETDQLLLVIQIGSQVLPNGLGTLVNQAVVKSLVVAVVESQLLQFPLHVPIGLCHKQETVVLLTDTLYHLPPEF